MRGRGLVGLCLALSVLLLAVLAPAQAQDDGPRVMNLPDRLAPPPLPAQPTQADYGAHVYWLSCMTCHGDRGQGLTDEWRAAWAPGDRNCWQSKCHAANHPPEGFRLPYTVPPVIGAGTLTKFVTAADLHAYLKARMPWHQPGSLPDEQYWQLTAYLIRANGLLPTADFTLTPANARTVPLASWASTSATSTRSERRPELLGILGLVLVGLTTWGVLMMGNGRYRKGRWTIETKDQ
ncbi:MAG: hypothetical protein N2383_02100 [Caldilineales bacterium]|nr:hypothetical protein [Caldilineales bacterium]